MADPIGDGGRTGDVGVGNDWPFFESELCLLSGGGAGVAVESVGIGGNGSGVLVAVAVVSVEATGCGELEGGDGGEVVTLAVAAGPDDDQCSTTPPPTSKTKAAVTPAVTLLRLVAAAPGDPDQGATEPWMGASSFPETSVPGTSGDAGTARALSERPAAWMMPPMRSTRVLARLGANGSSASASSAMFG